MPTALTDTQPPPVILDLRNKPLHPSPPRSPSPSSASSDSSTDPLIAQVIAGLRGTSEHVVPGQTSEDRKFAYKRSIPTMTLYSQRGLEIYEDITNTKAYYPFAAEKEILERFGDEIACRMFGLPSSVLLGDEGPSDGKDDEGEKVYERTGAGNKPADKEKWGDPSVGLHNYGVNGSSNLPAALIPSQGLAVELGSGSLDKTRHLLRSMAKLLQPRKGANEGEGVLKAIDYKAVRLAPFFCVKVVSDATLTFKVGGLAQLDLEAASLHSTLSSLASVEGESVTTSLDSSPPTLDSTPNGHNGKRRVSVSGLHATYDEGLAFLKAQQQQQHQSNGANGFSPSSGTSALSDSPLSSPESSPTRLPALSELSALEDPGRRATSILWLGSSCGNYTRSEAVEFLRNIELREGDTMVIGIDACADGPKIVQAYNDPEGVTRAFILEGVDVAGRTLGPETAKVLNQDNFEYVNRWNVQLGRHEAYVRAKSDLSIPMPDGEDVELSSGELLNIEFSYKYTYSEALSLFHLSGFRLIQHWTDSSHSHYLYLVEKPRMWFPATPTSASRMLGVKEEEGSNEYGVPRLEKWEEMWKAWDALMLDIIPPSLRFTKPIPLRHIPLFYVGHIPAFRDIHLSRYFSEPLTSPSHFADLFERGIDPCTDEPDKINHWHSEVPAEEEGWPAMEEIVQYERRVRDRVREVYAKFEGRWERRLARVLMMVFEHEMMHWETAIYICLQACTSLNIPPGMAIPDFASLSRLADREIAHERAVLGPNARQQRLTFDARTIEVGHDDDDRVDEQVAFDPSHEFGWDVENPKRRVEVGAFEMDALPVTNGEYLDWLVKNGGPEESKLVPASWAVGEGGKVAVKTLYGEVPIEFAREWPVAACADQLERFAKDKGGRLPTFGELSVFLQQNPVSTPLSNVGFEHLHPVPPTLPGKGRDGSILPGTDGGLWQWTSSPLEAWEGYHDSVLYPGYSSDFMDGKHRIVLGGSYASPRRIVRPTMVNWYYGDYLFVLAGARIAYDV
ncbi:Ergothioneine biosynthesis protein 1 [Rhodotorula toruloides]|nr:Ergothioneine biosynthesis protein 1 [Rhodotorula toruloides]